LLTKGWSEEARAIEIKVCDKAPFPSKYQHLPCHTKTPNCRLQPLYPETAKNT
jgi:hypothetical protein